MSRFPIMVHILPSLQFNIILEETATIDRGSPLLVGPLLGVFVLSVPSCLVVTANHHF